MHSAHGTRPGFAVELIPIDLETSTSQPFVRRAAGVVNYPGAERRADALRPDTFRIAPARRPGHPQGRSAAEDATGVDQVEHWGMGIFYP
jgi:hypothetical protein